jgi:hypothetical protein
MMRNLIVFGCAALLAIGLSMGSFAGSIVDNDSDGVPNEFDNCREFANGPLAQEAGSSCDGQEDGDLDGYGNGCDTDTNNDGASGLDDVSATFDEAAIPTTTLNYDFNCDGAVGLDDVSTVFDDAAIPAVPGPSDLPCAGTPICVAE